MVQTRTFLVLKKTLLDSEGTTLVALRPGGRELAETEAKMSRVCGFPLKL